MGLSTGKPTDEPASPRDNPTDIGRLIAAFEATTAALTVRAERAEAEADRLIAIERAHAERAEVARAEANTRAEIAEAMLAAGEAELATLRQAERERRALGLVARLRAALRGE